MRVVIGCLVLWNVIGLFLFGISSNLGEILSIWRLNPIEVYKYFKVNYFGCFWLTLFLARRGMETGCRKDRLRRNIHT